MRDDTDRLMRVFGWFVVGLFAIAAFAAGQDDALPVDPDALDRPDPLELKIVNEVDCPHGWTLIALDEGWVVPYVTRTGYRMPNWISEERLVEHFRDHNGEVVQTALELAKSTLRQAPRVTCRWEPLRMGEPA